MAAESYFLCANNVSASTVNFSKTESDEFPITLLFSEISEILIRVLEKTILCSKFKARAGIARLRNTIQEMVSLYIILIFNPQKSK